MRRGDFNDEYKCACPGCGNHAPLEDCHQCRECRVLFCSDCLDQGCCEPCIESNIVMPESYDGPVDENGRRIK